MSQSDDAANDAAETSRSTAECATAARAPPATGTPPGRARARAGRYRRPTPTTNYCMPTNGVGARRRCAIEPNQRAYLKRTSSCVPYYSATAYYLRSVKISQRAPVASDSEVQNDVRGAPWAAARRRRDTYVSRAEVQCSRLMLECTGRSELVRGS